MTFDEFVKKYNGKATDYDGSYGVQCTDLIKLYVEKVFDVSAGSASWGNAKYYWTNTPAKLKKITTKITNTASFVPKKGDIMVWNGNVGGGSGHVAICTGEGTTSYFYSYDQNWNSRAMHKVKHDYDDVYGVLRPNDQNQITGADYKVGEVYTLQVNLNVRTGAGTSYAKKMFSALTADGKKNAVSGSSYAILKKGTKVTCKDLKTVGSDVWMKIPSGWIAAYYNGEKYVE